MVLKELIDRLTPLYRDGDLILLGLKHEIVEFPPKDILVAEIHLRYLTLYKMPKSLKRKLKNEAYRALDVGQQKEILKILESFDSETLHAIVDYLSNPSEEARWSLI